MWERSTYEKQKGASKNMKISRRQTQRQKSNQMNKYQCSLSSTILWTLPKMDKVGTQRDGPRNKEIDDDEQGLTLDGWYKQTVLSRK